MGSTDKVAWFPYNFHAGNYWEDESGFVVVVVSCENTIIHCFDIRANICW